MTPEKDPRLAQQGNYAQIIGTEGWVALSYMGLVTQPESLRNVPIGPNDVHLPRSPGHEANSSSVCAPGRPRSAQWRTPCVRT